MPVSPFIPFGQWLPDMVNLGHQGLSTAKNIIPKADGYAPMQSLAAISDALGAECRGARAFLAGNGSIYTFAGTATKLYLSNGTSWTDVTRLVGGNYTLGVSDFWYFIAYGDRVIATNYADDIQTFVMGTSAEFSLMSATAPRCRSLGIIGEFVFLIDTVDTLDGARGNRIWWSPIGNPTGVWAVNASTQCDYDDVAEDSSPATALVGSQDLGVLVKGTSIYRVQYVGPPYVFSVDLIEAERGSKFAQSVIGDSRNVFYISEEGFYKFDSSQSIPIGHGRVDEYFKSRFDSNYGNRLQAAVDPVNKLVAWAYPGPGHTGGRPNFLLVYSWAFDRWTEIEVEVEALVRSFGDGLTLEEIGAIYGSLEAVPFSLDSAAWKTNSSIFSGFNSEHKLGLFDSDNMDAVIITAESQLNPMGKAYVKGIEPVIDYEDDVTVQLGSRDKQKDAVTYTGSESVNEETGFASFDSEAKFHTARFDLSGNDWSRIKGFKLDMEETAHV